MSRSDPPYPLEPDGARFDELTAACVAFVREHLLSLAEQPAAYYDDPEPVAAGFRESLPASGRPLEELLARLGPAVATSFNTAGPGYLAFIPGGGVYAAALADYLAASVNRYTGVWRAAPALVEIEDTVLRWLAELMGYPATSRGILTTGGSLSNFTAIVTARVARLGDDFGRGVLYMSEETHISVPKSARLAGFAPDAIRSLPVDGRFRLDPAALERAIAGDKARGRTPFLLVANVGTVGTGAVDPLPALLEIARRENLWVHADAAYGGFFRLAPGGPALMSGIDDCDSITLDPHKALFLPYGTGCLLVRDGEALLRAHEGTAAYLKDVAPEGAHVNFTDLSPELSRDFRGIRIWLPFMLYGVDAFRAQVGEKLALARLAYERLSADPLFEVIDEPQLTVVAFRLRTPADLPAAEANALNEDLLRRVNARRRVFLSSTTIAGRYTLRICVVSFRTHRDRLEEALGALHEEAAAVSAAR